MRFLVDESTGPLVAAWLRQRGYEVFSVYHQARGMDDDAVIAKAASEGWVLITNDKDFGDKVFRDSHLHRGVLLLRLDDERPSCKIDVIARVLAQFGERLADAFVVATESRVRFAERR
jgi:predicted nuclease of predicted toxin-antitoxin system